MEPDRNKQIAALDHIVDTLHAAPAGQSSQPWTPQDLEYTALVALFAIELLSSALNLPELVRSSPPDAAGVFSDRLAALDVFAGQIRNRIEGRDDGPDAPILPFRKP